MADREDFGKWHQELPGTGSSPREEESSPRGQASGLGSQGVNRRRRARSTRRRPHTEGGPVIRAPARRALLVPIQGRGRGVEDKVVVTDLKTAGVGEQATASLAGWVPLYPKVV